MSKSFRTSFAIWNETKVILHKVNHRVFYLRMVLRSKLNRIETVFFFFFFKSICSNFNSLFGSCRETVVIDIYRLMFSLIYENRGTVNTLKRCTFSKKSLEFSFMKRHTKPKPYYFIENHLKFFVL